MSYCFNPQCQNSSNSLNIGRTKCQTCGYHLLMMTPEIPNIKYLQGIKLLGKGGFGQVIEVKDERGIHRVVKILDVSKFSKNTRTKVIELFQQEAQILSDLDYPGIPRFPQGGYFLWPPKEQNRGLFEKSESMYCIVMEKISGSNLQELLSDRENWPIAQKQVISWLKELVKILSLVHAKHYIHRDIKPSNIMRRSNGQLVLIDFGAARAFTDTYLKKIIQKGSTVQTVVPSSYGYTPLEQLDGRAIPQSDFFALGRTFVHILTGKHPTYEKFKVDPQTGKLNWRSYAPDVSESFANLIDDLMEPSISQRPKNTQIILQRIDQIEHQLYGSKQIIKFKKPLIDKDSSRRKQQEQEFYKRLEKIWAEGGEIVRDGVVIAAIEEIRRMIREKRIPSIQEFISRCWSTIETLSIAKILNWARNPIKTGVSKVPLAIILLVLISFGITLVKDVVRPKPNYPNLTRPKNEPLSKATPKQTFNPAEEIKPTTSPRSVAVTPNRKFNQPVDIPPTASPPIYPRRNYVSSVVFSPDGKLIATTYGNNQVNIWKTETGELIRTVQISGGKAITFSPDGKILVTVSMDETVQLWDVKTGRLQRIIPRNSNYSLPVQRTSSQVTTEAGGARESRLRVKGNEQ